jgi:Flp pilus assembly protein TadG
MSCFGLRLPPVLRPEDGLAALELAILAPVIIVLLLLVVGFGRVTHGRQLVDQAAAAAARAAALSSDPATAAVQARQAATDTLDSAGMSCTGVSVEVDTSAFGPGGEVGARVRCIADLSGLSLAGLPSEVRMTAVATAPLETYRDLSRTGGEP